LLLPAESQRPVFGVLAFENACPPDKSGILFASFFAARNQALSLIYLTLKKACFIPHTHCFKLVTHGLCKNAYNFWQKKELQDCGLQTTGRSYTPPEVYDNSRYFLTCFRRFSLIVLQLCE